MIQRINTNINHTIRGLTTKKIIIYQSKIGSIHPQHQQLIIKQALEYHKHVLKKKKKNCTAFVASFEHSSFLLCSSFFPPFPLFKASISCNSTFSNAGTTTVTSGPVLCHETLWAWPTISRHTAYMCVASPLGSVSLSLGPERVQHKLPTS